MGIAEVREWFLPRACRRDLSSSDSRTKMPRATHIGLLEGIISSKFDCEEVKSRTFLFMLDLPDMLDRELKSISSPAEAKYNKRIPRQMSVLDS